MTRRMTEISRIFLDLSAYGRETCMRSRTLNRGKMAPGDSIGIDIVRGEYMVYNLYLLNVRAYRTLPGNRNI